MSDLGMLDRLEDHFHIDGPHDQDKATEAAQCAAALIRYLNHATLPGARAEHTLKWANTVHAITGNLSAVAHGQHQLLDQLAGALDRLVADDPSLYDDRYSDEYPAAGTATQAADVLRAAANSASQLGDRLQSALDHTVHLGNR